jgi:hypothetical protein
MERRHVLSAGVVVTVVSTALMGVLGWIADRAYEEVRRDAERVTRLEERVDNLVEFAKYQHGDDDDRIRAADHGRSRP